MTQEDKDLLLKDLCARLPYKVKCCIYNFGEGTIRIKEDVLWSVQGDNILTLKSCVENGEAYMYHQIKPYLFPLSSMTVEEFAKLKEYGRLEYDNLDLVSFHNGTYKMLDFYLNGVPSGAVIRVFDWLNKNHFDYRGLIERGLAIDATNLNIY